MTPLDAAQRLSEVDPLGTRPGLNADDDVVHCYWCERAILKYSSVPLEHAPDCPWLQMPRIVAALEAAERVVTGNPARCGARSPEHDRQWCSVCQLKAALQGEKVSS